MWKLVVSKKADKQISKLDAANRRKVERWLMEHIEGCENPRLHGHALHGSEGDYWTYRIGDYRVVCDIQDDELVVLAIRVEHRREVYTQRRHKR